MPADFNLSRRSFLESAAMTIAAAQLGVAGGEQAQAAAIRLPVEGRLPSLGRATEWLNSQPLTAQGLRGKVVLIDFWTFSCINSIRTLPYLRMWAEKYKDEGIVVIGVQAPEFEFEKNVQSVQWAVKDRMLNYPIAIDNDHGIWHAFDNEYWPALYIVDARGQIRHHVFGENGYERLEPIIQQLLEEAGNGHIDHKFVSVNGQGIEAAADWGSMKSPETYVGHERAENFASPGGFRFNKSRVYVYPRQLDLNHWALAGDWTVGKEAIAMNSPNGRVAYHFHARDLHLIMGPAVRGATVRFRVLLDEHPPDAAHGVDVDAQGNGTVVEQRLYQLIRQAGPVSDRQFEIEFLDSGVEAFDFTFG
jgi:thiol-disulfide isomerase/thioredoxin